MKKIFIAIVALVSSVAASAQVTEQLTATLQVGEQTTVFYGNNGFASAVAAAEDNAIITLSSGYFNNPGRISKPLKVYGAGFETDTITGIAPTQVSGSITFDNTDAHVVDGFYLEGIYMDGSIGQANNTAMNNLKVVKCRFTGISFGAESSQIILRQCKIEGGVNAINSAKVTGLMIQNSYVTDAIGEGFSTESGIVVDHCILTARDGNSTDLYHGPWYYTNTIINRFIRQGGVCYNCVGSKNFIERCGTFANCYYITAWGTLFADGQNNIDYLKDSKPRSWELAAPTTYVGTDGTPVGPAGGSYAWNKIPSTPRIIQSSIGAQTSADGKLNISIKAEARPVVE
ncbi:MAG: hypothetical protein IJ710_01650 [Prevotella sp.]|nr:hypothetical protein [Prevotella sp.]